MNTSYLHNAFQRLSQRSVDSVQNGNKFTALEEYMHVKRPIEDILKSKMDEIDKEGGGIICLVGSAGDGKSHMISNVRRQNVNWGDECFYNDATASSSPYKTAVETLKEALSDFKSENIKTTNKKLLLAINLGKLNAFIDEDDVKNEYKEICNATRPIFDDDDNTPPKDSERVKVVLFTDEQIFEFYPERDSEYPIDSDFLSSILEKIISPTIDNPFYNAYIKDKESGIDRRYPLLINYELLMIPEIRHTIVMTIIEAIIRFNLIITPREFLDFIFSIMVYVDTNNKNKFYEKKTFYESLLPSLLYCGGSNIIKIAVAKLDPLKHSNSDHDEQLSLLFTSYKIPKSFLDDEIIETLPKSMIDCVNDLYDNNGIYIEPTTKFLFRLKYILSYKSENLIYISYLSLLKGMFNGNIHKMEEIYNTVSTAIPHHYGSYYNKKDMIPLNIQGSKYKMFAPLQLKAQKIILEFNNDHRTKFYLRFDMNWKTVDNNNVHLRMDYQLYSYLYKLNNGKLSLSYENEKNLEFSRFIRELTKYCKYDEDITIVESNNNEKILSESSFGNIQLS